jgi:sugar phosphate permease
MRSIEVESIVSYETIGTEDQLSNRRGSLKAWTILSCAWAFYLYEYILRVSPSVMISDLMLDYGVTSTALGVLVSFYYFSYVALQVPCGVIVDRFGPRKVITLSAVLCVIGSIYFAQSDTLLTAQIGRFLMGAGSACAYLSCAKIGAEWFDSSKFAGIAGRTMMMGTLGGTFGGRPCAMLVNTIGWRSSMLVGAVVGSCIAIAAWMIIRDHPNTLKRNQKGAEHANASLLEGLKIVAANPQNWLIGLYGCMMYLPLSAFAELWGVPFLMQLYNINNELASTASIMVFLGMALGTLIGPWLSNKCKSRVKIMSWSALGTFLTFLVVFYIPNIPLTLMFPLLFLGGMISGGQILYFAAAKEINPDYISGTTIGFTNCLVMVSGVIFQPLLGMLLDLAWDGKMSAEGAPIYDLTTYKVAFSAVSVALLVSWVIVQYVRETYNHVEADTN